MSCSDNPSDSPNHAPEIQSVTANPSSVQINANTTLSCVATDEDRDELEYSWSSQYGAFPNGNVGSMVQWIAPTNVDTFYIEIIVSDGVDIDEDQIAIVVTDDSAWSPGIPPSNPSHGDEWTAYIGIDQVPLEMIFVQGGTFWMGAQENESDAHVNEFPRHHITITEGFWVGKYEITQAQWEAVMGNWAFNTDGYPNHPAEMLSPDDIKNDFLPEFGDQWRLPTEAEWEYICRAGFDETWFWWGNDYSVLSNYAWYVEGGLHDVGQLSPNPWGFYDMHGNVWEWCNDFVDVEYYSYSPSIDPQGPESGDYYVRRGGSYQSAASVCRSATRHGSPSIRYHSIGFRIARDAE